MTDLSQDELDKLLAEAGAAEAPDTGASDEGMAPEDLLSLSATLQQGWDKLAGNMSQSLGEAVALEFDVGVNTTAAAIEGDAAGFGVFVHFDATVGSDAAVHGLLLQDSEVAKLGGKISGEDGADGLTPENLQSVLDFLDMSLPIVSGELGAQSSDAVTFGAVTGLNLADAATDFQIEALGFADPLVRMEYTLTVGEGISCALLYLLPLGHARSLAAQSPSVEIASGTAESSAADAPAAAATFSDFDARGGGGDLPENIDIIMDIQLEVVARLGRVEMPIRDILKLGPGSIIDIDRPADGPVDLVVNDKLVARGDVVVVHENFGLKVTEVQSAQERIASLR